MTKPLITLGALTERDAPAITKWREAARAILRTPFIRSVEEQKAFILSLPDHRYEYRYWAVKANGVTVGIAGLVPIEWENGRAEVSLVLNPAKIGQGIGSAALALVLEEAFARMRLVVVTAEVYAHNPALTFWAAQAKKYGATATTLTHRKFWHGQFYESLYVTFTAEGWAKQKATAA